MYCSYGSEGCPPSPVLRGRSSCATRSLPGPASPSLARRHQVGTGRRRKGRLRLTYQNTSRPTRKSVPASCRLTVRPVIVLAMHLTDLEELPTAVVDDPDDVMD